MSMTMFFYIYVCANVYVNDLVDFYGRVHFHVHAHAKHLLVCVCLQFQAGESSFSK